MLITETEQLINRLIGTGVSADLIEALRMLEARVTRLEKENSNLLRCIQDFRTQTNNELIALNHRN